MLRRSVTVLFLLGLLGLAMILVYALFNREGADKALREAREALAAGSPGKTVRLLNLAQRSLGPNGDREKLVELHRLRYRAHLRLGNFRKALSDLDVLQQELRQKDPGYERDRIQVLLAGGKAKKALRLAQVFLEKHGEDGLVLDLAGRASQHIYQKEIRDLIEKDLAESLPQPMRREAVEDLVGFLYREPGDPIGRRIEGAFQAKLRAQVFDPAVRQRLLDRCRRIHQRIEQSTEYYRKALRRNQALYAALQGASSLFQRAGEQDRAALLCTLYMERFPGYGSAIAARRAAFAWSDLHSPGLAKTLRRPWFRGKSLRETAAPFFGDPRWAEAWFWLARIFHQVRDRKGLETLLRGCLRPDATALGPYTPLVQGYLADLDGLAPAVEAHLATFCTNRAFWARPPEGPDLFLEAILLRWNYAASAPLEQKVGILDHWAGIRPRDPEPLLRRSLLYLDTSQFLYAIRDAGQVLDMPDRKNSRERALDLLLRAKDEESIPSGRDSKSLFLKLAAEGRTLPETIPHPVQHLGIAAHAISFGLPQIAMANARRILDRYPWSRTARFILAQGYLRLGRPRQALFEASTILDEDPDHLGAALLLREALAGSEREEDRERAKRAARRFCMRHPENLTAQRILGEALLARGAYEQVDLLCRGRSREGKVPDALAWLHGRALAELGASGEAIAAFERVRGEHRKEALGKAVSVAAASRAAERIPPLLEAFLAVSPEGPELVRLAGELAKAGYYEAAERCLSPILLDAERFAADRNGRTYLLHGEILLAMDRDRKGRDALERAFSFPDGDRAAPLLALQLLLDGNRDEALEVLSQVGSWEGDPVILGLLAVKLGRRKEAAAFFEKAVIPGFWLRRIFDLCLQAALPKPGSPFRPATGIPAFDEILRRNGKALFEALALSRSLAFREEGRRRLLELENSAPPDAPFPSKACWGLLRAFQERLAGRNRESAAILLSIVQENVLFLPAYDECCDLLQEDLPELLIQPDMLARYGITLLTFGVYPDSKIASLFCQGTARLLMLQGKTKEAADMLGLAGLVCPTERGPRTLLIEDAVRRRDWTSVLIQEAALADLPGPRKLEDRIRAFRNLSKALDAGAEIPRDLLAPFLREARALTHGPHDRTNPPLGRAAVLLSRQDHPRGKGAAEDAAARAFLGEILKVWTEGSLPPSLDEDGVVALLKELAARGGGDTADRACLSMLDEDPSLFRLWIFRARRIAAREGRDRAVEELSWIPRLLPVPEITRELGRLYGLYGYGKPETRQALQSGLEGVPGAEGRFARAALAFRRGDPASCLSLLDQPGLEDGAAEGPEFRLLRAYAILAAGNRKRFGEAADLLEDLAARRPKGISLLGLDDLAWQARALSRKGAR